MGRWGHTQQAVARDRPTVAFIGVEFGTLGSHLSEGYVAAREPQAVRHSFR
jgi:hypothetical protein